MLKKIVIATGNPGKLREIAAILAPLAIEVVPQTALGVSEAQEPHATFVENALAKARHSSLATGLPALADDSGICVEALNGAPGVHSARYAEGAVTVREAQDRRNNEKLVAALAGNTNRRAHYICVIVLVRHADDPEPLIAEGRWHGEVIATPRGEGGFGYDPYFLLPVLGRTAAELDAADKNRISHRGQALTQLVAQLRAAREG